MAFSAAARVRVSDQNSDHRNKLGTVLSVSGNAHRVRLDGLQETQAFLLTTDQLQTTTQPCPFTY